MLGVKHIECTDLAVFLDQTQCHWLTAQNDHNDNVQNKTDIQLVLLRILVSLKRNSPNFTYRCFYSHTLFADVARPF